MEQPQKLLRSRSNRMIGGVCAGFSHCYGIDVSLIRVLAVLLLLNGIGGPLYLLLWLLLPSEPEQPGQPAPPTGLGGALGTLLIGVGAVLLMHMLLPGLSLGVLLPLLAVGFGIYLLLKPRKSE